MSDADSPAPEAADARNAVPPMPKELVEDVDRAFADFARALSHLGELRRRETELQNRYMKARSHAAIEAMERLIDQTNEEMPAAWDAISAARARKFEVESAVRDFLFDHAISYGAKEAPEEVARRSFSTGMYSVSMSAVNDLDDDYSADDVVGPYLEARLGFDFLRWDEILKRVNHVSKETLIEGISLEDAIHLKKQLALLGAKADVVEGPSSRRPQDRREPIPESVRHEVWRRDGGACIDCGSRERLEFDHIIPVSKGGSNTARNIQLRCESCNRRKAASI